MDTENINPVVENNVIEDNIIGQVSDDVIKNHPLYKQLLSESIERRKTIAEMKKTLDALQQPKVDTPKVEQQSIDALLERIAQLEQKLTSDTYSSTRTAIIQKYNIDSELADRFLTGKTATELEEQAKTLANLLNRPVDPTSVGGSQQETMDNARARILQKVVNPNSQNPLSSDFQRSTGGSPIVRKY